MLKQPSIRCVGLMQKSFSTSSLLLGDLQLLKGGQAATLWPMQPSCMMQPLNRSHVGELFAM